MSGTDNVFIVIPAYNESCAIGDVLTSLLKTYSHIVVVDDGSTDGTYDVAATFPVHLRRHEKNLGQGAALQTGISEALALGAEIIVTFDADGQHSPDDIPRLTAPIMEKRVQIVFGSRFLGEAINLPLLRRWVIVFGTRCASWLTGIRVSDANCGLRAFSREAALGLNLRQKRMAHTLEILEYAASSGLPYCEVPVTVTYTAYSLAKGQRSYHAFALLFDYLTGKLRLK